MITDNNFGKRDKKGNWKPNDKIIWEYGGPGKVVYTSPLDEDSY